MNGALLDTGFLITLTNSQRAHHQVAVRYFQELIRYGVPMYISTVVVSEFEVRQPITDLGLKNFIVLPFNVDHARLAGRLTERALSERGEYSRVAVKDDIKLIAQCEAAGISHFFTADDKCGKFIERLRIELRPRPMPFAVCISRAFSGEWFGEHNQGSLDLPPPREPIDEFAQSSTGRAA